MVKTIGSKIITEVTTTKEVDFTGQATAASNSVYVDSGDNLLKFKNNSASVKAIMMSSSDTTIGRLRIDTMLPDPNGNYPEQQLVGNNPALGFDANTNEYTYFSFALPPDIDLTTVDIAVEMAFCMKTANTSKNVVLCLDTNIVANTGDMTPVAPTIQTTQTISVPNTPEELKRITTTTLGIPIAYVSANTQVCCKFYRNASSGSDDAVGDFQLLDFTLKYKRV